MFKRRYAPAGSHPGTLVLDKKNIKPHVEIFKYSATECEVLSCSPANEEEQYFSDLSALLTGLQCAAKETVWIDVSTISCEKALRLIASQYNLHDLSIADIVNIPQRPKIEEQEDYVLIITSIPTLESDYSISFEQVSIIVGAHYVLTFQEKEGDVFDPVRNRIRLNKGNIRKSQSDYLAYALIDAIIDIYFPILESLGYYLEELEEELVSTPNKKTLKKIYEIKRSLLQLRRSIWPHREIFSAILRDEYKIFKKNTRTYVRDIYDHTAEIIDVVETYRELTGGFMEVYLSSISNKLNDVMKVLTVISTVFMPLSFIASVYGMNFENMPELKTQYGYPILLSLMLSVGLSMLFFFWRKGWLTSSEI